MRTRAFWLAGFLLFCLVLLELGARGFWLIKYGAPVVTTGDLVYAYYPGLKEIEQRVIRPDDAYLDILLLGGSVLHEEFGSIPQALLEAATRASQRRVRVHNLSAPAHTSLDSYYKYARLSDKSFDVIVVYHGINETRANNSPPSLFKSDYSHYSWYDLVGELLGRSSDGLLVSPHTFRFVRLKLGDRFQFGQHVPINAPRADWLAYGREIKTAGPFRRNLEAILDLAEARGARVVLTTFAFYLPDDYSEDAFRKRSLDYTLYTRPTEIWGDPQNVVRGIATHNAIIQELGREYRHVTLVDMNALIPKEGRYFNDICHLTHAGSQLFVDNLIPALLPDAHRETPTGMSGIRRPIAGTM